MKPVDRIERLIQKIEVAPAGVQQDLTGGVDDNLVARAVFAKAVDATTGKTLFKSDTATLEPGGQSAPLTLKNIWRRNNVAIEESVCADDGGVDHFQQNLYPIPVADKPDF